MTPDKIKNRLLEFCTLIGFDYKGKRGGVDPFNPHEFDIFYGDEMLTVSSIEEVMTTPLFDGKSLNDIYNDIEIDEW